MAVVPQRSDGGGDLLIKMGLACNSALSTCGTACRFYSFCFVGCHPPRIFALGSAVSITERKLWYLGGVGRARLAAQHIERPGKPPGTRMPSGLLGCPVFDGGTNRLATRTGVGCACMPIISLDMITKQHDACCSVRTRGHHGEPGSQTDEYIETGIESAAAAVKSERGLHQPSLLTRSNDP